MFGFLLPVCILATTVIPPDFDQLVNESDYVVRSIVKSVTCEYRDGPNGRVIMSKVELEVKEVIAGTPPSPLVLEMLGGRIGKEFMRIDGAPRFKVGDEDILFVSGNGHTAYPLFALMHGRYPVMRDAETKREYVARSNHVPLENADEVAMPMEEDAAAGAVRRSRSPASALTPAQFIQRVRNAVRPRAADATAH